MSSLDIILLKELPLVAALMFLAYKIPSYSLSKRYLYATVFFSIASSIQLLIHMSPYLRSLGILKVTFLPSLLLVPTLLYGVSAAIFISAIRDCKKEIVRWLVIVISLLPIILLAMNITFMVMIWKWYSIIKKW